MHRCVTVQVVIDLSERPSWLKPLVGKAEEESLTTPCAWIDGTWYTDSADIMEALPSAFPATAAPLLEAAAVSAEGLAADEVEAVCGVKAMMLLISSEWDEPDEHPFLELWAPFETALAQHGPFLGGATLGLDDLRCGSWCHALRQLDILFSAAPLDWGARLPHVSTWLEGQVMPRIREATTYERRYQMLLSLALGSKMPALAKRVQPDIKEEIAAARELARVACSGAFVL